MRLILHKNATIYDFLSMWLSFKCLKALACAIVCAIAMFNKTLKFQDLHANSKSFLFMSMCDYMCVPINTE